VRVVTAISAGPLATYDPIATDAANTLAPPSRDHWLGSDHLGRDIYSRIVHGARVSLVVGALSTLLGAVLGGIIGLLSAYFGGKTGLVLPPPRRIPPGFALLLLGPLLSSPPLAPAPDVLIAH